jgi:hypothetical protein
MYKMDIYHKNNGLIKLAHTRYIYKLGLYNKILKV